MPPRAALGRRDMMQRMQIGPPFVHGGRFVPILRAQGGGCDDLENLAFLAEGGTLVSKVESAPEAVLTRIEEVAAGAGPTDLESWVRATLQLVAQGSRRVRHRHQGRRGSR
jgi:hypothetical protein